MSGQQTRIENTEESEPTPQSVVAPVGLPGKLAGLSLSQQVYVLAMWPFLEQLLNFLVGTVDLFLAGRLQDNVTRVAAMDAIAVAGYVGWLMNLLSSAMAVGATALISRAIGANDRALANRGVGQAMLIALGVGLLMMIVVLLAAPALAALFTNDQLVRQYIVTYLHIIALASPCSALLFIGGACLRGAGDTRNPFFAMVTVNVVNVGMSCLLVFGPAPLGGHGVAGIAWGTAIAWLVGAIMIVAILQHDHAGVKLLRQNLVWDAPLALRILRVGLPNLLESGAMWGTNAVVLKVVGWLPLAGALGSHMIAVRIEAVSYLPGVAVGIAAATLTGQYLGAGQPQQARAAAVLCWKIAVLLMSAMGVVFLLFPRGLVWLISPDTPEHMASAPILLQICSVIQPFFATYLVLGAALRGAGDTKATMWMSFGSLLLVRALGVVLLGVWLQAGLAGVWVALCLDLMMRGLLFGYRFQSNRWMKVKV